MGPDTQKFEYVLRLCEPDTQKAKPTKSESSLPDPVFCFQLLHVMDTSVKEAAVPYVSHHPLVRKDIDVTHSLSRAWLMYHSVSMQDRWRSRTMPSTACTIGSGE
mgnify:CR=1 FL=1